MTYASSPDVALPGDVVLEKTPSDEIADFDLDSEEGNGLGADEANGGFDPYLLLLPPTATGTVADLEIHGLGDGNYTVELSSGTPDLPASTMLEGVVAPSQVVRGNIVRGDSPTGNVVPNLSIALVGTSGVRMSFPALIGRRYQLQRLSPKKQWEPEALEIIAVSDAVEWNLARNDPTALFSVLITEP